MCLGNPVHAPVPIRSSDRERRPNTPERFCHRCSNRVPGELLDERVNWLRPRDAEGNVGHEDLALD